MRERIRRLLGEAIVEHHFHQQRIANILEQLAHTNAAAVLRENLPRSEKTRKGNFGEIVASEHLVQRYGYEMPVFKLRFRDHYDQPMRGEDIIGFVRDKNGRITVLCGGEAKTIATYASRTVVDAYARLTKTYRPRAETLSLLAEILYDRGDGSLAREVDRIHLALASTPVARDAWIMLITENRPDDPFGKIEELTDVIPSLSCVNLSLPGLSELVNDLFDTPRIPAVGADSGTP